MDISNEIFKSHPVRRFGTVRQTADAYPVFTESSLRWLIFNETTNGFEQCVRRIGRKVLIDWDALEDFIG